MNIFQLKSKPHGIERLPLFLEQHFICIGYPNIGDLSNVTTDEIEQRLAKSDETYTGQTLAFHKGVVNTFINTMQDQDIVLITEGEYVHIGKVGSYQYNPNFDNQEGMCHRRPVEWLAIVERNQLNEKVKEHLKNRATITKFKYPFPFAELDLYLTEDHNAQTLFASKSEIYEKAWHILVQALNSDDEQTRTIAAAAIWQTK